jgi:hypothetical protein
LQYPEKEILMVNNLNNSRLSNYNSMINCEHVWSGESFDATKDVLEIELTHVMIQIKCEKCGMNATVDSEINWKPVSWEVFESI